MAVPDFQSLMRPMLEVLADGNERTAAELRDGLAERFHLSPEDRAEMLPSGTARLFDNRVGWATTYLERTAAVARVRRAVYRITDRGRQLLAENAGRID